MYRKIIGKKYNQMLTVVFPGVNYVFILLFIHLCIHLCSKSSVMNIHFYSWREKNIFKVHKFRY